MFHLYEHKLETIECVCVWDEQSKDIYWRSRISGENLRTVDAVCAMEFT